MLRGAITLTRMAMSASASERATARYRIAMRLRGVDLRDTEPEELGLDPDVAVRYTDSGGPALADVLRSLNVDPHAAVLDIGCGKGGALLTLAKFFARADGVELAPALVEVARRNLQEMRVRNSTVYCADASAFTALDAYALVYMYNPFPEVLMTRTIANLCDSLRRRPRKLTIIYLVPICERVLLNAGFRLVRTTEIRYPAGIYQIG